MCEREFYKLIKNNFQRRKCDENYYQFNFPSASWRASWWVPSNGWMVACLILYRKFRKHCNFSASVQIILAFFHLPFYASRSLEYRTCIVLTCISSSLSFLPDVARCEACAKNKTLHCRPIWHGAFVRFSRHRTIWLGPNDLSILRQPSGWAHEPLHRIGYIGVSAGVGIHVTARI